MGCIAGLRRAEAIPFYCLGQDYSGATFVLNCAQVRVVDLLWIMAAAVEVRDLLVGHSRDEFKNFWVLSEEVLASVPASFSLAALVFTVDGLFHPFQEQTGAVARQQIIPIAAPNDFNYVPSGATKDAFELVDDLAIAAHRSIEALQIAVHNEDQIVELLARGNGQGAEGFRFIGLAITYVRPNFPWRLLDETPIFEITHEASLVNRVDRSNAHRNRRETPEIGHQPRVRI